MKEPTTDENTTSHQKTESERRFERAAKWLPRIAVLLTLILLGIYFGNFKVFLGNNVFGDNNAFGTFGDFLGGALNPILGFLTVWLLITSIRFQMEELRYTRVEIQESTDINRETKELHATNMKNERDMFVVKSVVENLTLLIEQVHYLQTVGEYSIVHSMMKNPEDYLRVRKINFNEYMEQTKMDFNTQAKFHNINKERLAKFFNCLESYTSDFDKNLDLIRKTTYPIEIYKVKCNQLLELLNAPILFFLEAEAHLRSVNLTSKTQELIRSIEQKLELPLNPD